MAAVSGEGQLAQGVGLSSLAYFPPGCRSCHSTRPPCPLPRLAGSSCPQVDSSPPEGFVDSFSSLAFLGLISERCSCRKPLAEAGQLWQLLLGHAQQWLQAPAVVGKSGSGSVLLLLFRHGLLLGKGSIPSFHL